jgi:hypothetical protein
MRKRPGAKAKSMAHLPSSYPITVADLQDSLDYLRLSIKYIMFDLEATRRERDALKQGPEDEHPRGEN